MTKYIVATSHGNYQVEADYYSVGVAGFLFLHRENKDIVVHADDGKAIGIMRDCDPLVFASWRSIYEVESGMTFSEIIVEELGKASIHSTVIASHDVEEQNEWRAKGYRIATDKHIYSKNVVMTKYEDFKEPKYQLMDLISEIIKEDPEFIRDYCSETLQHMHDMGILMEQQEPIEALEGQGENDARDEDEREHSESQPPDGGEEPLY